EETLLPEIVRSEVNLLVLPFFALWDKDVRRRAETEFKKVIKRGDRKLEIYWNVSAHPKYGYPGPFDKRVFKAIEQIINEMPPPIQNPICIGSLYSFCKRMGINTGGKEYRKIKEALRRISFTAVVSRGAFYSKGRKKWIEDDFHLIDRIVFKGEELENGEIADTNYIYLNTWYLDNINALYVKPLDWKYYHSLETPIAQRLYELLSVKFYGLILRGGEFIVYHYSTLCDLLPIARQEHLSDAKKILDPTHRKLKETGFLEDWVWEELPGKNRRRDWLIKYYPGGRAREEIERYREYEPSETEKGILSKPDSKVESKEKPTPLTPAQTVLVEKLVELNISEKTAQDLVRNSKQEIIERWIEAIRYTKAKDKAAYLVKAIKENWVPPEKYLRAEEEERLRLAEEEREREKRRRKTEESMILEEIYSSLSPSQKEEIDREIEFRLPSFVKEMMRENKTESQIVRTAWKAKKEEILKEWLESGRIK
ncbi:TPA: hypothetical protein ENG04_03635, partial [Candidatus Poribacteria bacterium]|nr:hypothetical protein [Candidatus Poribacteria bacterium]HEX29152.1 hypothetical protein [Candidatus Poribacteria bacterium]